jgi:hypothetical protein
MKWSKEEEDILYKYGHFMRRNDLVEALAKQGFRRTKKSVTRKLEAMGVRLGADLDKEYMSKYAKRALNKARQVEYTISGDDNLYLIESSKSYVDIFPMGDLHVGHAKCDERLLRHSVAQIKASGGCVIGIGDWFEAVTKHCKFPTWEQKSIPRQQMYILEDIFKGVPVLAMIDGNHEHRMINSTSISPIEMLADKLGANYAGDVGIISIRVGDVDYSIAFAHGRGAGKSNAHEFEELAKLYPHADVYLLGHDHQMYTGVRQRMDGSTYRYCRCGTYLRHANYALKQLYTPTALGCLRLRLFGKHKRVEVSDCWL